MDTMYFKKMVKDKGLLGKKIHLTYCDVDYVMDTNTVLEIINIAPEELKKEMKNTFAKIDFQHGDLLHYLEFIALDYIKSKFKHELKRTNFTFIDRDVLTEVYYKGILIGHIMEEKDGFSWISCASPTEEPKCSDRTYSSKIECAQALLELQ